MDLPGGDLRLLSNSPCINSGRNSAGIGPADFDGNPRPSGGAVDVGVYEFQNPASVISYAWLMQYGLPLDGSADGADADGDGVNNWGEWRSGTHPINAASALRITSVTSLPPRTNRVAWTSVSGRAYFLQRSTNLAGQPAFTSIATNLTWPGPTLIFSDTNAPEPGPYFYRVGVH